MDALCLITFGIIDYFHQLATDEKDILIARYNSLQQDIDTYENNIGFFTASKNAEPLIAQMRARIESAKEELRKIEEQIRKVEDSQQ